MSIQPFGATQRNLFVRPGTTTTTSAKAAASATSATSSQPAAGTPDVASASPTEPAMRRRIENYLDHADKRIDHMLEHGDLSPRQQEALKNAQESFHAQMGRLDRALDGGEANDAMHNILSNLRGSIDAILQDGASPTDPNAATGFAKSGQPGRTVHRTGDAHEIDTLA